MLLLFIQICTRNWISPDISIAEESRDAKAIRDAKAACEAAWVSDAEAARYAEEARKADKDAPIYKIIMSAPQRWAVMDDFTRSVNTKTPQTPAFLNGNLKPRKSLSQRVLPPQNLPETTADDIDIEEDGFIGLARKIHPFSPEAKLKPVTKMGPGDSEHLWLPLPFDLPNIDKRLPTQMAAWEGNVDKYARLMHPRRLRTETEYDCILRGIYHHTSFARWWEYQLETNPGRIILPGKLLSEDNKRECRDIRRAINARKIMNNDISELEDDSDCLPWLIWWPVRPHENTLRELAAKCPSMRPQVAITSILCDYILLFKELRPPPRESFYEAAKQSRNPYYLNYLNEFVRVRSIDSREILQFDQFDTTVETSLQPDLEPRDHLVHSSVEFSDMIIPWGQHPKDEWGSLGIYGGQPADPSAIERYMWLSTEAAQKIEGECWKSGGVYNSSSDIGWLYIDDDDPNNELYQRLSRRLKPMTSFELEYPEYESETST